MGRDRYNSGSSNGQIIGYDGVGALEAGDIGFNGQIVTKGDFSTGFIAQSVGGGGGMVAWRFQSQWLQAWVVLLLLESVLEATVLMWFRRRRSACGYCWGCEYEGNYSPGMLVQSVGGGGGNGGSSVVGGAALSAGSAGAVNVGLGGIGGDGSRGGNVYLASGVGEVRTAGESSTGITVQSIGGGGGNGGFNVTAGLAGAGGSSGAVSVGLGGGGGAGGMSGEVKTHLQSDVYTTGVNSTGILAQSVGGGGGNGGFNVSAGISGAGGAAGAISVGLGGAGGEASDGGLVNATATGNILTKGHNSGAFIAQSVGGGGGNGGFNVSANATGAGLTSGSVSVGLGGSAGGGGDGKGVTAFWVLMGQAPQKSRQRGTILSEYWLSR